MPLDRDRRARELQDVGEGTMINCFLPTTPNPTSGFFLVVSEADIVSLRMSVEDAFKIALDIESSEIDVIYGKLLQLGGPQIGKTMENLGVPASVQRQKLKAALRRFCSNPELLQAAERL